MAASLTNAPPTRSLINKAMWLPKASRLWAWAGAFAQLRLITLPMLRTIIEAAIILRVIGLVNSPDLLLILTQGGPGRSTQVLSLYAFQNAYSDFNFGYAGALSTVMFVLLMLFAWAYIRLSKVNQD